MLDESHLPTEHTSQSSQIRTKRRRNHIDRSRCGALRSDTLSKRGDFTSADCRRARRASAGGRSPRTPVSSVATATAAAASQSLKTRPTGRRRTRQMPRMRGAERRSVSQSGSFSCIGFLSLCPGCGLCPRYDLRRTLRRRETSSSSRTGNLRRPRERRDTI